MQTSPWLEWIYLANATLLIVHEIDSAYWKEWELFRLRGGIAGFLLLHVPLVAAVLVGLLWVHEQTMAGLIFSAFLGFGGVFAFGIHAHFLRQGRPEFRSPASIGILIGTLALSLVQLAMTIAAW